MIVGLFCYVEVKLEIADLFGCEDLESIDRKIDFERMLASLSERDQKVVWSYAEGNTYDEIGQEFGLTKGRISQILAKIKQKAL